MRETACASIQSIQAVEGRMREGWTGKTGPCVQGEFSGLGFEILKSTRFGEEELIGSKEGAGMSMHF